MDYPVHLGHLVMCQDHQVQKDTLAHLAQKDTLAHLAQKDTLAYQDHLAQKAQKDMQDQKAQKDIQDHLGNAVMCQDHQDRLDTQNNLAIL